MAQWVSMTKKRAEDPALVHSNMRRWEHTVLEAPFFSRKAALGSEELELAQSVQVLPGDLTPTFSHVSWSGCL